MSQSEITNNTLPTAGLKVHDILADYFTKDLKVKAAKSNVTMVEEGSPSDENETNNGENKKHHHRHKKHKKGKKRKKSHKDDDLYLVEEYKKRKLEYEELVRQEEIEKKKSRRISVESVSSKEENISKKRSKHHDHKHFCKKHRIDNNHESIPNSKSVSTDASKKSDPKKKLMSTIMLVKDLVKEDTSVKDVVKEDISVKDVFKEEEDVTRKLITFSVDATDEEKNDKNQNPGLSSIKIDIQKISEPFETDSVFKSGKILPQTEDNLVVLKKENRSELILQQLDEIQMDKNEISWKDPITTTNIEKSQTDEGELSINIANKEQEMNKLQGVTKCNPENLKIKPDEKDICSIVKKTSKISFKNLKNLDLPSSKEIEPNVDSADKQEVEEGEVIDSDDDNDEDENVSDFFKEHLEGKEEHKKKKKVKHKHKKKKKKKSKDNSKSPEHRTRRLSESSHHHSHGSHYTETDARYYDNYLVLKRPSRDRSHSPKHVTDIRKPRKFHRESSMSMDLREKIDKKRLLEIARKNVLTMIEKGTLPSGVSSNTLAQQQLVTLRAGGKSVAELTEFCKGLVNGKDYLSSDSSDEDGRRRTLSEEEGDTPFINHPFKLKEPLPHIRMNIPNAVQIPIRTADTAKLRQIFPVSSGNQHRIKELEWVPVEKTETTTTITVSKKNKEPKAIMPPPPPPPPTPLPPVINPAPAMFSPQTTQLAIAPAPPLAMGKSGSLIPMSGPLVETSIVSTSIAAPVQAVASPVIQPESEQEQPPPPGVDISTIVAKRLNAVRRLQENPLDVQALNQMFQAQQQMKDWAHSKLQPGQFGAAPNTRLLTPEELSGPSPVWAKKNQLTNAAPLSDGIGMNLLRKMGWNPGEGLGKNKEGSLVPLMLDVKMDKKGLVSTADTGNVQVKKLNLPNKVRQDLSGKHPVSALMELCSKRKWGPPEYTLLDEGGPAHRKNFLFKVRVQGTDYQPSVSSPNKKQAKALAAQVCLQGLGLLPR